MSTRKIKGIIIHCSATKPSMDIGVEEITDWHVIGNKWSDIGYHYVIKRDGTLEHGRDVNKDGAHCKGHNKNTVGICLVGGVNDKGTPQDNFTPPQYDTLESLVENLVWQDWVNVDAYIKGHNEFSSKACPSFDVQEWRDKVAL
jgi:N-acetyl-anhydromuramyl-L-alanine amidase AmpD